MIDGYYLSTDMRSDEININPWGAKQSATLWQKDGSNIRLLHHWNVENVHDEDSEQFINKILERKNLSKKEVNVIDFPINQIDSNELGLLSQEQLNQALLTLLSESEKFYKDKILLLSLDKLSTSLHVSITGNFQFNKILPLAELWELAEHTFHMSAQKLFDLANSCETRLPVEQLPHLSSLETCESVCESVNGLLKDIDDLEDREFYKDTKFSLHQHKISMFMKTLIDASKRVIEIEIQQILNTMNISCKEFHLAITGNHPLKSALVNFLNQKYKFKSILPSPCFDYNNSSLTDGIRFFFNESSKLRVELNSPQTNMMDDDTDIFESPLYAPYIHSLNPLMLKTFVQDIIQAPVLFFNISPHNTVYNYANSCVLIDPRSLAQRKKVNTLLNREWWQSITAVVLESHTPKWYEHPLDLPGFKQILKLKPAQAGRIPGVDNQHNISTVEIMTRALNPRLFNCVQEFERETKIPLFGKAVLQEGNWSPIKTAKGALDLGLRKRLPILYINGTRIQLQSHDKYFNNVPLWV